MDNIKKVSLIATISHQDVSQVCSYHITYVTDVSQNQVHAQVVFGMMGARRTFCLLRENKQHVYCGIMSLFVLTF